MWLGNKAYLLAHGTLPCPSLSPLFPGSPIWLQTDWASAMNSHCLQLHAGVDSEPQSGVSTHSGEWSTYRLKDHPRVSSSCVHICSRRAWDVQLCWLGVFLSHWPSRRDSLYCYHLVPLGNMHRWPWLTASWPGVFISPAPCLPLWLQGCGQPSVSPDSLCSLHAWVLDTKSSTQGANRERHRLSSTSLPRKSPAHCGKPAFLLIFHPMTPMVFFHLPRKLARRQWNFSL